jgi:hypothetical protein
MRRILTCAFFLLPLVVLSGAPQAQADTFVYKVDGNTFEWQLPSSPTPDFVDSTLFFQINNVSFTENGAGDTGTFSFFSTADGGGLALDTISTTSINAFGAQLYTGTEANPTFLTGVFSLNEGSSTSTDIGTLTITPEPSTLLLLFGGLVGGVGSLLRRRVNPFRTN